MYRLAERLDPEGYLRLATAVFAEMALAGYTAVGEFHYLHHGPGGIPYDEPNEMGFSVMQAAARAGLRLTLLDTCYLEGGFDTGLEGPQLRFGDADADGWLERVEALSGTETQRVGAAIHSVRAVPPPAMREVAAWAERGDTVVHAHVSEQTAEQTGSLGRFGASPLEVLATAGAVSPRFTAVHGTHLGSTDIELLGQAGGGCCFCPTTERDLGDGIGPAVELLRCGVTLSIGSDSQAVIDGFEEARAIELDCRLAAESRGLIDAAGLLSAATAGGARSLGWDAGVLHPGYLADFVTIDLDGPRLAGCDPASIATAVFAAGAPDVSDVVIGGRTIVSGGRHQFVDDPWRLMAREVTRLWA
jgi:formiminoglutamate deiminase